MWVIWNIVYVHLKTVLVSVQDWWMVCAKRTISSENHFGRTWWHYSETTLVSVQDWWIVCAKRTISSEIVLCLCYVWHKLCPYFAPTLTLSRNAQNEIPNDARRLGVASGASKTIFKPMVCSAQTVHLSCVKISTFSKRTEMSFPLSLEPRSAIRCVQNDFCAYVTFGTNHAPILHRH
jgi:hypothetical protein